MQILSDINMEKNQILKAIIENVPSDPNLTKETDNQGRLIYNTTDKKLKYCNGTEWIAIDPKTTNIDTELSDRSTNDNVAGAKAVVDYVFNATNNLSSLNKIIEYSPALRSVDNTIEWNIPLEHDTKAIVQVFEANTNELVFTNIKNTSSTIKITIRGIDGNLTEGYFYAIIIY